MEYLEITVFINPMGQQIIDKHLLLWVEKALRDFIKEISLESYYLRRIQTFEEYYTNGVQKKDGQTTKNYFKAIY
jgi:hypothetical protein